MNDSPIDYTAVLADLREKRSQIDAAIAGIEKILGVKPSDPAKTDDKARNGQTGRHADLGPGAFLGMSIVDATKKLLAARRQNMKTNDILSALKEGGIVLSGESPINVVGSVLNRNYNSGGEIVKVSRGEWGLAEWHPRLRRKGTDGEVDDE